MPADSEPGPDSPADPEPELPRTFRPFGVRIAVSVFAILLLTTTVVMWFAFPPRIRAEFTGFQVGTVIALGLMFYAGGFALARSRVVARVEGLTVVNGYRTRRFAWNEVLAITLRPGSPWAVLDLSNGTSVPAMGIQGSDGTRSARQVRQLRTLVDRLTR